MRSPIPDELALPHFEDRLWAELADLHREGAGGPPPRRPRRGLLAAAGVVAVAGIGTAALALAAGGDGERESETVAGGRPVIDPDATIVYKVMRPVGDPSLNIEEEWFDEVTAASRHRVTAADGSLLTDSGWPEPPGIDERPAAHIPADASGLNLCNPETRSMVVLDPETGIEDRPCDPAVTPWFPQHEVRTVDYCSSTYRDATRDYFREPGPLNYRELVKSHGFTVTGTEVLDGRELLRIEYPPSGVAEAHALVDPDTYEAVQETVGGGLVPALGQVTTWQRLPRTEENLALLTPPVPDGFAAGRGSDCDGRPWPGDNLPDGPILVPAPAPQ
jgi:hypothetical protein